MIRAYSLLLLLIGTAFAAEQPSPAVNWVLPVFSDKEGYRILRATGAKAQPGATPGTLIVTNLGITVFTGDASEQVETVFLSPLAIYSTKDNRANGTQTVRLIREDLEATAINWTYEPTGKHVTLKGKVRIVFNAELKDVLK